MDLTDQHCLPDRTVDSKATKTSTATSVEFSK